MQNDRNKIPRDFFMWNYLGLMNIVGRFKDIKKYIHLKTKSNK